LQERLSAVVDRTRRLPHLSPNERTPGNRVPGCVSSVWLIGEMHDNHLRFRADADSPVVRGLVGLLADFASGQTPADLLTEQLDPLDLLDLKRSLSPTRRHGLEAVTKAILRFAQTQTGLSEASH